MKRFFIELFCRHSWDTHQHGLKLDAGAFTSSTDAVIAWKQCKKCGGSRLLHILK